MEEAREIIKVASGFLAEQEPAAKNSRLEQLEERAGSGMWSVVLSFPDFPKSSIAAAIGAMDQRVYKELVVNGETKEVMALKFWK